MLTGKDIDMLVETAYARGRAAGKKEMHDEMTLGSSDAAHAVATAVDAATRGVLTEARKHVPEAAGEVLRVLLGLLGG